MAFIARHEVPADRETVWRWHEQPGSLARLNPTFFPMTPRAQAASLKDGTTVLSLPAGLKWEARHDLSGYVRGQRFRDVCVTAPIRQLAAWHHNHIFSDLPNGHTLVTDEVFTRLPDATLKALMAYRQHQLIGDISFAQRLREFAPVPLFSAEPLTIALTGSRGMVGRALAAQLSTLGHTVIQLVRPGKDPIKPGQREWNPLSPDPALLDGVDILVHLAGETIMGRFSEAHKKSIADSRIAPTRKLAELAARHSHLKAFLCASAIGYYGADRSDVLDECSSPGEGFLADVCREWEAACLPAADAGIRTVNLRTGIVLSGNGGVLPILRALISTGLGGKVGEGENFLSWIAIDDECDLIIHAIFDERIAGPINLTAPNPMSNRELTAHLATKLRRPARFPIPTFGPKLVLGREGAEELALANQHVLPAKALDHGFQFRYPTLDAALSHELGNDELLGYEESRKA